MSTQKHGNLNQEKLFTYKPEIFFFRVNSDQWQRLVNVVVDVVLGLMLSKFNNRMIPDFVIIEDVVDFRCRYWLKLFHLLLLLHRWTCSQLGQIIKHHQGLVNVFTLLAHLRARVIVRVTFNDRNGQVRLFFLALIEERCTPFQFFFVFRLKLLNWWSLSVIILFKRAYCNTFTLDDIE